MKKRRGLGLGGLFFGIFIMNSLVGGIGTSVFPFLLAIGIFGLSYAIVSSIKEKKENLKAEAKVSKAKLSSNDEKLINEKLAQYFADNMNLVVTEDISLALNNGKYHDFNDLCLSYRDEKVISLGEFGGRFGDVYDKIVQLLLSFAKSDEEIVTAKKVVDTSFIDKIDELNEAIPQEEISSGLYQTCDLLKRIELLKSSNSDIKKVNKLYDYYLPILVEVLERYKKLQAGPDSEEFRQCESQLIKTIYLINEALKTICSSLQEDDYMNINADISTLQSLLKKDGLVEDHFGEK